MTITLTIGLWALPLFMTIGAFVWALFSQKGGTLGGFIGIARLFMAFAGSVQWWAMYFAYEITSLLSMLSLVAATVAATSLAWAFFNPKFARAEEYDSFVFFTAGITFIAISLVLMLSDLFRWAL